MRGDDEAGATKSIERKIFGTDGVRAFLLPEGQEVALVVL